MGHPQVTMILNTLVWSNLCKDGQLWMGKKKTPPGGFVDRLGLPRKHSK